MFTQSENRPTILGSVAPGFEPVRAEFETNFVSRGECGAACTVYHQGQKVVDLWGGRRCHHSGARWTEQTLSLAFSVTKGMAAAVMAVAHSRGLFDLDAPVAAYWPEFGCDEKRKITVRQLLAHQAGLVAIDRKLNPQILADHDQMAAITASQKPLWQPGTRHGYHTLTLGWYQNELIRRVDPAGRTLGEFFQDEIASPLGIEFYIGLPDWIDSEHISSTQGFRKLAILANLNQLPWKMVLAGIWPQSVVSKSIKFLKFDNPAALGRPEYREVEIPSANGFGQARAVAKVYDVLARGGRRLGITPGTMQELVAPPLQPSRGSRDAVLKIDTNYSFGFSRPSDGFRFGADDQAFGCPGAGGSFGMADPSKQLAFAYLTNTMSFRIFDDPRERAVRQAVYQCIGAIQQRRVPSDVKVA
ncbi:MAG: beta-lactamase family protein [Phycisphaera sp. RhM]|nr:beta-lactamase family protein [Phycisphaera sp. RhM]